MRIRIWYDIEVDLFVGKDYDSGVMSQGEGSLDALLATQEAVHMYESYKRMHGGGRTIMGPRVDQINLLMPRSDGFDGWICGNNYRRRGRIIKAVGSESGEPWYIADDGTQWSAFDVTFKPDAKPTEDAPLAGGNA